MSKNILICDDDQDLSDLMKMILEHQGYQVTVRGDAEDCLSLIHRQKFDCILVDLNLPGMNGLALMDEIQESRKNALTSIIAVTVRFDERDSNACFEHGAKGFISKPITPESLISTIEEVLIKRNNTVLRHQRTDHTWQRLEQRRFHREEVEEEGKICRDPYEEHFIAQVDNISADGLGLRSKALFKEKSAVYVRVPLFSDLSEWIRYTVAWCKIESEGENRYGLQLAQDIEKFRSKIRQVVNKIQIKKRRGF